MVNKKIVKEYLYCGLAICALLVIVAGFQAVLKPGRTKEVETLKKQTLLPPEQKFVNNPNIRVLIMTDGYAHTVHPQVTLSAASGLIITCGGESEEYPGSEWLQITPDDVRFQKGYIRIQAMQGEITVGSLRRGYGNPSYNGVIELRTTAEGIALINELPVESYLCRVVPSEMPSSYEQEALKAQAVCARSYAYRQMADYGYPEYEAHVNDSTDYQVYGNSAPSESAQSAVEETCGEAVFFHGQIVTTYYYSTSCGRTTSMAAWGTKETEENSYLRVVEIKNEEGDYERNLPWYRWEAVVPVSTMSNLIGLNTKTDVGMLQSIEVSKTGPGGAAIQIKAKGDKGEVVVETENKIRRALGGKGYTIRRQDGSETASSTLLPSAFFTIERSGETFVIRGGGYGHGIGMSQNGANEMAKCGKNYKEILELFYPGTKIAAISEEVDKF